MLNARIYNDKEMKAKSKRWEAEMHRAREGRRLRHDTIPGDLQEALDLADHLFTPGDGAVLKECLVQAFGKKEGAKAEEPEKKNDKKGEANAG